MLPVTHVDLLVILAFTIAIVIAGFSFMGFLVYRVERESREGMAEIVRISRAIAGLVYQEEEKTRALLREHGAP
jgi:hypothetical protein